MKQEERPVIRFHSFVTHRCRIDNILIIFFFIQYSLFVRKEYLFWISYLGNESVIVTTPVDGGNDTRPQMLREKLHNISRLQHDVKNKQ